MELDLDAIDPAAAARLEARRLASWVRLDRRRVAVANAEWQGHPLDWLRRVPDIKTKGTVGAKIVSAWLVNDERLVVTPSAASDADRLVNGVPVEIKFSFRGADGGYRFNQIRADQAYDFVCCFGISPDAAHAWILPTALALQISRPQHGGKRSDGKTRTAGWRPDRAPDWLLPYGGRLDQVRAAELLGLACPRPIVTCDAGPALKLE